MAYLKKTALVTTVPATPGVPGYPGAPGKPAWVENICSGLAGGSSSGGSQHTESICFQTPLIIDVHDEYGVFIGYRVYSGCYTTTTTSGGSSGSSGSGVSYNPNPGSCLVYHPAVAPIPAVPAIPPTPAKTMTDNQAGWNAVAWSVDTMDEGTGFKFTMLPGSRGVLVALSPRKSGVPLPISALKHALLIDTTGAYVLEKGAVVARLPYPYGPVRIERTDDGRIVFSTSQSSTRRTKFYDGEILHLAVMTYQANDGIKDFDWFIASSLSQSAQVSFSARGSAVFAPDGYASVAFSASSSLELFAATAANDNQTVEFFASSHATFTPQNSASVTFPFPLLGCHAGNAFSAFADCTIPLFSVESWQEEAEFVPIDPTGVTFDFSLFMCAAVALPGSVAEVDVEFPLFSCMAANYIYGEASVGFPLFSSLSYVEEDLLAVPVIDLGILFSWFDVEIEGEATPTVTYDVTFESTMGISSTMTGSLSMLESILASLTLGGSMTGLLSLNGSIVVRLVMSDAMIAAIEGSGAVPSEQVWVLNLDSGATSRYTEYGFNSYLTLNGKQYGVADDGLYELGTANDNGDNIDASLRLAVSQLDSVKEKRQFSAYAAVASDDVMLLKVVVDGGDEYVYEARSSSTSMQTHRIDIGRGLRGTHWQFTVANNGGADFDLQSLEFRPIDGKRRV